MKFMTAEQLAAMLNSRQYGNEITKEEEEIAKANNLLVVYGSSDDLVEFGGQFSDEADVYGGGAVVISRHGILKSRCSEDDTCPYFVMEMERRLESGEYRRVKVYWSGKCSGKEMDHEKFESTQKPYWCYGCEDFPGMFATFDIFDEDTLYCQGVVIDTNKWHTT